MSEVMECTSCGFKNWQMTCWSCNAVLPVTKQVEELKAENERLREELIAIKQRGWNTPDTKPGDGDSIWVEVIEHDGVNRHVDYAVTWVDHDGLQVRRFEQNSRLFCQSWPPDDVIRWCHCRVPESSLGGDDE